MLEKIVMGLDLPMKYCFLSALAIPTGPAQKWDTPGNELRGKVDDNGCHFDWRFLGSVKGSGFRV